MSVAANISEQHFRLRKQRIAIALRALVASLMTAESLFAAFAVGAYFGPAPLRPLELLFGVSVAVVLALAVAPAVIRHRLEEGAKLITLLKEGRKTIRLALFEGHVVLGPEIVLRGAIISTAIDGPVLVLRYRDPRFEGAVLRELSGDAGVLRQIEAALEGGNAERLAEGT
jgi:hypothetical protein